MKLVTQSYSGSLTSWEEHRMRGGINSVGIDYLFLTILTYMAVMLSIFKTAFENRVWKVFLTETRK